MTLSSRLPAFTWDQLAPLKEKAALIHHGPVDLSIGTPVDPVPEVVRRALSAASDAPGYPLTAGTPELRRAAAGWLARRHGVTVTPDAVLPVIGTKEFIAALPAVLGLGSGDTVAHPALAYPTYGIGARLCGAHAVATDSVVALGPARVSLMWVNSPSNPTGKVLPVTHLAKVVSWARSRGCVVASDECYICLAWEASPVSVLHPSVCGDSHDGLLAVHSLSKRSNMAGYRAGFVAGDPALIADLLAVRRQAGMMVPAPIQAAMAAALNDDSHAAEQHTRYGQRRSVLLAALRSAGFRVDDSQAGLYLWTTYPKLTDWDIATMLAERYGIVVVPGSLYGPSGNSHVRIALTATDERIAVAAARLRA